MNTLSEIFLGNLKFSANVGMIKSVKQGMNRFAGLKIKRAVFCLYYYIRTEISIKRFKLFISTFHAVCINLVIVYKRAPYNNTAMRSNCISQAVGSLSMSFSISFWSWLSFRIGFN